MSLSLVVMVTFPYPAHPRKTPLNWVNVELVVIRPQADSRVTLSSSDGGL